MRTKNIKDATIVEEVVEEVIEQPVEEVVEPEAEEQEEVVRHANGIVKAKKLYVRKEADKDGDVLTIISGGTGVEINLTESTEDYYKVRVVVDAELKDGYCKKEFIDIK